MARRTDPALTRRAIGWVRRTRSKLAATAEGPTDWEAEFLASVEERLDRFGSAFSDPDKGQLSAPLSLRQGLKLRQMGRRASPPPPPAPPQQSGAEHSGAEQSGAEEPGAKEPGGGHPPPRKPAPEGRRSGLTRRKPLQSRSGLKRSKPPPQG